MKAVFTLGFRPFFIGASAASALLLGVWLGVLLGWFPPHAYYDTTGTLGWHAHEMIFGFVAAAIAGFLLTAVPNWTGVDTAVGPRLAALFALWALGRAAPFLEDWLPRAWIAGIDLAFLPALIAALAVPLWRQRKIRNLAFVPILMTLFVANALIHAQALWPTCATARTGRFLAIDVVLLLIAVVGGRLIPLFTRNSLSAAQTRRWPAVEAVAIASLIAMAAMRLFSGESLAGALPRAVAALAALAHGCRLWGWYDSRVWSVPLLWILYVGYAWLVIGLALSAVPGMPALVSLHAFSVGAMGSMIMGMMSRVSLGHTGRPLRPSRAIAAAFGLVALAGLVRVVLPIAWPGQYAGFLVVAAVLWIGAFALFLGNFAKVLAEPRVHPGTR